MKKLLFVIALGCSMSAGAQLTVLENGQTVVGSPTSMTKVDSNATLNIWNHNPTSSTPANTGTISFGEGSKAKIFGDGANGNKKLENFVKIIDIY